MGERKTGREDCSVKREKYGERKRGKKARVESCGHDSVTMRWMVGLMQRWVGGQGRDGCGLSAFWLFPFKVSQVNIHCLQEL